MNHILTLTCPRDWPLSLMLRESIREFMPNLGVTFTSVEVADLATMCLDIPLDDFILLREPGFGQWGWASSMVKIAMLRQASNVVRHNDYLVCVDSDVHFTSGGIFRWIAENNPPIAGGMHDEKKATRYGMFAHLSGACMFIRGDVLKSIAYGVDYEQIEREIRATTLSTNEDVVVSYLAVACGWNLTAIPPAVWDAGLHHHNTPDKSGWPEQLKAQGAYPPWRTPS